MRNNHDGGRDGQRTELQLHRQGELELNATPSEAAHDTLVFVSSKVIVHLVLNSLLRLLTVNAHLCQEGEGIVGLVAVVNGHPAAGVLREIGGQVIAGDKVCPREGGELSAEGGHLNGTDGRQPIAVDSIVQLKPGLWLLTATRSGVYQFHTGITFNLLVVKHLGPVIAGIVHEEKGVGLRD